MPKCNIPKSFQKDLEDCLCRAGRSLSCPLLRYDMSELWEMGRGAEMQAAEAAERNQSVLLCRVKTWPQLMCCALV